MMKKTEKSSSRRRAPAQTPEARENQMIALAMDRVEDRMLNGKASAQEYIYFLKIASTKSQLELEKLRNENELLKAKADALESAKKTEELYRDAIKAMRAYSGAENESDDPNQVILGID